MLNISKIANAALWIVKRLMPVIMVVVTILLLLYAGYEKLRGRELTYR